MFYSTQILARKGPLGLVWMAAHMDRSLKRSQVHEASIESSVDMMLSPEAPLALRLSGQLLLGVCRIYSRKVAYLLQDCQDALVKIRLAFRPDQLAALTKAAAGAKGRRGGAGAADADAPVHTLPLEFITLPDDLDELQILAGNAFELGSLPPAAALGAMMTELQQSQQGGGRRRRRGSVGVSLATAPSESGLQGCYSLGLLLAPSGQLSSGAGAGGSAETEIEEFEDAGAPFQFDLEEVEIERLRAAPASEASGGVGRQGAADLAALLGGGDLSGGITAVAGRGGSDDGEGTGSPSSGLLGRASRERESGGLSLDRRRRSTAAAGAMTFGGGKVVTTRRGELGLPDLGLDGAGGGLDLDLDLEMDLGSGSEERHGGVDGSEEVGAAAVASGPAQTPAASGIRRRVTGADDDGGGGEDAAAAAPSALRTGATSSAVSFTVEEIRAAAATMAAMAAANGDPYDIPPEPEAKDKIDSTAYPTGTRMEHDGNGDVNMGRDEDGSGDDAAAADAVGAEVAAREPRRRRGVVGDAVTAVPTGDDVALALDESGAAAASAAVTSSGKASGSAIGEANGRQAAAAAAEVPENGGLYASGGDAMDVDDAGGGYTVACGSPVPQRSGSAGAHGTIRSHASGQQQQHLIAVAKAPEASSGAAAAAGPHAASPAAAAVGAATATITASGGGQQIPSRTTLGEPVASSGATAIAGGHDGAAAVMDADQGAIVALATSPPRSRRMTTRRSAAAAAAAAVVAAAVPTDGTTADAAPAAGGAVLPPTHPPQQATPPKATLRRAKARGDIPAVASPARRHTTAAQGAARRRSVTVDAEGSTICTSDLREWLQDRSEVLDPARLPGATAAKGVQPLRHQKHPKRRRLADPVADAAGGPMGRLHSAEPATLGCWSLVAADGGPLAVAALGGHRPAQKLRFSAAPRLQALFRVAVGQMAPQYALQMGAAAVAAAGGNGTGAAFARAGAAATGSALGGAAASWRAAPQAAAPGLAGAGTPAAPHGALPSPSRPTASLPDGGSGGTGVALPRGTPAVQRSGPRASAQGGSPTHVRAGSGEEAQGGGGGSTPTRNHRSGGSSAAGAPEAAQDASWGRGLHAADGMELSGDGGAEEATAVGAPASASGAAAVSHRTSMSSQRSIRSNGQNVSFVLSADPMNEATEQHQAEDDAGDEGQAEPWAVGVDTQDEAFHAATFAENSLDDYKDSEKENRGGGAAAGATWAATLASAAAAPPHLLPGGSRGPSAPALASNAAALRQPLAPAKLQQHHKSGHIASGILTGVTGASAPAIAAAGEAREVAAQRETGRKSSQGAGQQQKHADQGSVDGNGGGGDAMDAAAAAAVVTAEGPLQQRPSRSHSGGPVYDGAEGINFGFGGAMDMDPDNEPEGDPQQYPVSQGTPRASAPSYSQRSAGVGAIPSAGAPAGGFPRPMVAAATATPMRSQQTQPSALQQRSQALHQQDGTAAAAGTPIAGEDGPAGRSEGLGLGSMLRRHQWPRWTGSLSHDGKFINRADEEGAEGDTSAGGSAGTAAGGLPGTVHTAARTASNRHRLGQEGFTPFRSWTAGGAAGGGTGIASVPCSMGRLASASYGGGGSSAFGSDSYSDYGGEALLPRTLMELDAVARAVAAAAVAAAGGAAVASQQDEVHCGGAGTDNSANDDDRLYLGLDLLRRPFAGSSCPSRQHPTRPDGAPEGGGAYDKLAAFEVEASAAAALQATQLNPTQLQATQLRGEALDQGQATKDGGGNAAGTQQRTQPATQEAAAGLPPSLAGGGGVASQAAALPPWSCLLFFGAGVDNGDGGSASVSKAAGGCAAGAARLSELTQRRRRRDAARCFYDMLVLKSRGLVELQQKPPPAVSPHQPTTRPTPSDQPTANIIPQTAASTEGGHTAPGIGTNPTTVEAVQVAVAGSAEEEAVPEVWVTLTQRGVEAASVRLLPAAAARAANGSQ